MPSRAESFALHAALFFPLLWLLARFARADLSTWDMIGHLRASAAYRDRLWPALWGWNANQGFGGYPQGYFYPSLFEWLVGGLGKIVPLEWAFRALLGASVLLLPVSVLVFLRALRCPPRARVTAVFFMLTTLAVGTPLAFGGFFNATFQAGLVTQQWSLPIVFFYLAALPRIDRSGSALATASALLALVVLSHAFSAIAAVLLSLLLWPRLVPGWRRRIPRYGMHGALAAALSLVWVGPFLRYHAWASGKAIGGIDWHSVVHRGLWFYVPAAALCGLAIVRARRERLLFTLLLPVAILIALYLAFDGTSGSAVWIGWPLHVYRLLLFAFIFASLAAGCVWSTLPFPRAATAASALVFVVAVTLGMDTYFAPGAPALAASIPAATHERGLVNESWRSELTQAHRPHLLAATLEEHGAHLLNGVFVESSAVSPFVYGLLKELDSRAWVGNAEPVRTQRALAAWHERVLGVSYIVSDRPLPLDALAERIRAERVTIARSHDGSVDALLRSVYRPHYAEAELLAAAPALVSGASWSTFVRAWWETGVDRVHLPLRADALPAAFEPAQDDEHVTLSFVADDHYTLDIVSRAPRWVYVKLPYFPTWRARTDDHEVPLYEASVHMMAIFGSGHIELTSEPQRFEKTCAALSIATWIALFALLV